MRQHLCYTVNIIPMSPLHLSDQFATPFRPCNPRIPSLNRSKYNLQQLIDVSMQRVMCILSDLSKLIQTDGLLPSKHPIKIPQTKVVVRLQHFLLPVILELKLKGVARSSFKVIFTIYNLTTTSSTRTHTWSATYSHIYLGVDVYMYQLNFRIVSTKGDYFALT